MHGFFVTLGWGLAALVFVSVLVALVEYLRQVGRRPEVVPAAVSKAVHVDVDLAALGAAGDQVQRQSALDESLAHAARPQPDAAWIETSPIVLAGTAGARETVAG